MNPPSAPGTASRRAFLAGALAAAGAAALVGVGDAGDEVLGGDEHQSAVGGEGEARFDRLRRGETEGFDWPAFAALRAPLVASEGEGRAIVQLREAPVRALIDSALRDLSRAAHEGL